METRLQATFEMETTVALDSIPEIVYHLITFGANLKVTGKLASLFPTPTETDSPTDSPYQGHANKKKDKRHEKVLRKLVFHTAELTETLTALFIAVNTAVAPLRHGGKARGLCDEFYRVGADHTLTAADMNLGDLPETEVSRDGLNMALSVYRRAVNATKRLKAEPHEACPLPDLAVWDSIVMRSQSMEVNPFEDTFINVNKLPRSITAGEAELVTEVNNRVTLVVDNLKKWGVRLKLAGPADLGPVVGPNTNKLMTTINRRRCWYDKQAKLWAMRTLPPFDVPAAGGVIHLVDTPEALDTATAALNGVKELGFDAEWMPCRSKGNDRGVIDVLQLATETEAWVIQMFVVNTPARRKAVANIVNSALLAGVGVGQDDRRLTKTLAGDAIKLATFDIDHIAKKLGYTSRSLQGLTADVLGRYMIKSKGLQMFNWSAQVIPSAQLRYAAHDAWAGYLIMQQLRKVAAKKGVKV